MLQYLVQNTEKKKKLCRALPLLSVVVGGSHCKEVLLLQSFSKRGNSGDTTEIFFVPVKDKTKDETLVVTVRLEITTPLRIFCSENVFALYTI